MQLSNISIVNFKNIEEARIEFSPGVNCLLGRNGMGKSNLLEAIHFLSFARGFNPGPDSGLVRHGADMMLVKGDYLLPPATEHSVACGIVKGKGKTLKCDGKEYGRISEHIGKFPVVMVAPQDTAIVSGSGEERRKLTDMVISQADRSYLTHLIRYNRALESRNRMLRSGIRDKLLFESVESPMIEAANAIHATRSRWIEDLSPVFAKYYEQIAGSGEKASVAYRSVLNDETAEQVLASARQKDEALGFTSRGVHRDDIEMRLGSWSMRRLGSQGQIKTMTIALRLAIFEYLRSTGGKTPLLLLDDIFDKLDAERVERIMNLVSSSDVFGQIFITDTNRKHLDEIIDVLPGSHTLLEVENGVFKPLNTSL